jgi:asparagine synthase (glutamine-hydrolysing)
MCGLLLSNLPSRDGQFARAMAAMQYRGPDNCRIVEEFGGYSIGHCRLAIIGDPVLANQPMVDESGALLLIFNGEIYNYQELARTYDIPLQAHSDTELLLALYALKGASCVSELNGMFSFVIVDRVRQRIFAARDKLGTKPLFWWRNRSSVVICSEVAPILELIGGAEPDQFSIRQYRAMRGLFNGRSFYKGISTLPAGSTWDGERVSRYWTLERKFDDPPSKEELRCLLDSSLSYRMVADVEVAGFLSGGLDSTITTLATGIRATWCVGFAGDDDFAAARRVAEGAQLRHHEVIVDRDGFLDATETMVRARREPLCVPNEALVYLAARDARHHGVKCTLSGEGADELFGGYDRIFRWADSASTFELPEFARLYCYDNDVDLEVVEDALAPFRRYEDPYLIVSAFFQIAHLGNLLRRLDFATMFASVEGREPFADFRLAERLFGLRLSYKHCGMDPKAPLKEAYRDIVPEFVLKRAKHGFPVPLRDVFNTAAGIKPGYSAWFDHNLNVLGWMQ